MPGCSVQTYLIVPARRGAKLYVRPGPKACDANFAPAIAVTLCSTLSSFDQVTFSPTFTVTLSGWKRNPFIETVPGGEPLFDDPPPPQPPATSATAASMTSTRIPTSP